MPAFEQGLGYEEVAGGAGVDTVGDELGSFGRVEGVGFGKCGDNGSIEVCNLQALSGSEVFEEVTVTAEDAVVSAFKERSAGDVVVRRGLDQRDSDCRKLALESRDDVAHAFIEVVKNGLVEGAITGVVHAEHDRNDSWVVRQDIAP